jgi:acetoacetate decarboxylase
MATAGQLTKDQFGYSVPVDSPLYEPFPLEYEDVDILLYPYVTTAEAAAKLLPAQLTLAPVPGDTTGTLAGAQVVFARYGFSNVGSYNEVAQVISAQYTGTMPPGASPNVMFAVRLHVTNDMAMAAGREIGGFPKKLAHIEVNEGPIWLGALESPRGLRICTGEMQPFVKIFEQSQLPAGAQSMPLAYVSLRVIPDPTSTTRPYKPALCQLIYTEWVLSEGTFWGGRGTLSFTGASTLHPYHTLPIQYQVPAMSPSTPTTPGTGLFRGKMQIGKVVVLENF